MDRQTDRRSHCIVTAIEDFGAQGSPVSSAFIIECLSFGKPRSLWKREALYSFTSPNNLADFNIGVTSKVSLLSSIFSFVRGSLLSGVLFWSHWGKKSPIHFVFNWITPVMWEWCEWGRYFVLLRQHSFPAIATLLYYPLPLGAREGETRVCITAHERKYGFGLSVKLTRRAETRNENLKNFRGTCVCSRESLAYCCDRYLFYTRLPVDTAATLFYHN